MKRLRKIFCAIVIGFLFNINAVNAEDIVAKVGDTGYPTLKEAVDAAMNSENKEVILQTNVSKNAVFKINSGKEIILNLNSHEISVDSVSNFENSGKLTLKNGKMKMKYAGIDNKENATMTLDGITYEYVLGAEITNSGTLYIKNSSIITEEASVILKNKESGVMQLDNVTANVGEIFDNKGKLTINSGVYNKNGNLSTSNSGTLIINGGTFKNNVNMKIEENGVTTINGGTFTNGFDFYETKNAKLIINSGTFTGTKNPLIGQLLIKENTATLEINGGTFNYSGENDVFDLQNVKTTIKSGSINAANSSGIEVENSDLTIGENEGNVLQDKPIIFIPKGSIRSFMEDDYTNLNFYDGSITTKYSRIDTNAWNFDDVNDNLISVKVPTGYQVKYLVNNDNSYTAYLEKIKTSNDEINPSGKEENKDEINTSEKEEIKTEITEKVETEIKEDTTTEKNPQTGVKNIGIITIVLALISFLTYVVIRNKKIFVK